ncbi:MAG: HdaA/DnaA family protein [Alphaproteobacteria bacterium]
MKQLPFDIPSSTSFSAENFLVMPSNQAAKAWVDRWPTCENVGLVIFGGAGCGKTHLAQIWQQNTRQEAVFCTDSFEALADIQENTLQKSVILDDFKGGYSDAEEKQLFHLYNTLKERDGALLITSQLSPKQWKINLPDLKSRLLSLPAVEVLPPEDTLLTAIFMKLLHDRQLIVEESVIRFVSARIERSGKALEAAVEILDKEALQAGKRITLPFAKAALKNILD